MPMFRVTMVASASGSVDVEAATPAAAVTAAEETFYVGLCHQCAHEIELGDFFVAESDGIPLVQALDGEVDA